MVIGGLKEGKNEGKPETVRMPWGYGLEGWKALNPTQPICITMTDDKGRQLGIELLGQLKREIYIDESAKSTNRSPPASPPAKISHPVGGCSPRSTLHSG